MKIHQHAYATILLLACAINASTGIIQAIKLHQTPGSFPLHRLADSFVPLKPVFHDQRTASYLTDKNMKNPLAIAQYELAQFTLAPTVLSLNTAQGPLVLIDATDMINAKSLVEKNNLTPLSMNASGLILAVNNETLPRP